MIGKLMKYDIKKMIKVLLYIYVITIALGGITRLINIGKDIQVLAIIGYVFAGLTYSALASILVNTFVHILKVFTDSFYKDASYLTHTLPVNKNQLLLSKFLSSLIVIICSFVVIFLTLFIMFFSAENIEIIKAFMLSTIPNFNISVGLVIFLIFLILLAEICAIISMCFTAIVKANTYNSKRFLKGLLWFVLFYFASIVVTLIVSVIVFAIGGNLNEFLATQLSSSSFITILIIGLITYVVFAIAFYFICRRLFNKGVNVD